MNTACHFTGGIQPGDHFSIAVKDLPGAAFGADSPIV